MFWGRETRFTQLLCTRKVGNWKIWTPQAFGKALFCSPCVPFAAARCRSKRANTHRSMIAVSTRYSSKRYCVIDGQRTAVLTVGIVGSELCLATSSASQRQPEYIFGVLNVKRTAVHLARQKDPYSTEALANQSARSGVESCLRFRHVLWSLKKPQNMFTLNSTCMVMTQNASFYWKPANN